jgi:GT2 family glycosyltransferase
MESVGLRGNQTPVASKKPDISVIIPVHRGGSQFLQCISSVAGASPPPSEIIVVSDGNPEDFLNWTEYYGVRVLRLQDRKGPARARNHGARTAEGNILFFLDADVMIHANAVAQVEKAFRLESGVAAVFGSYDDEPAAPNFLSQYKNLFHHHTHQTAREEASSFWGACGAIRREVFLELGGFDERYNRPSIEDVELGYRLRKCGYRIRLIKDLKVKHLKRWGFWSLLKSDWFDRAIPWTDLILRGGGFVNDLNLSIINRLSVIFIYAMLASLLFGAIYTAWLFALLPFLAAMLFFFNFGLYLFFKKKRGWRFSLKAIPVHWFYFFYCGLAFIAGLAVCGFRAIRSPYGCRPEPGKGIPR